MGKRELVGNRQYTDEFKVEAVRLSESLGMTDAAKRWARRPLGRITYRTNVRAIRLLPKWAHVSPGLFYFGIVGGGGMIIV